MKRIEERITEINDIFISAGLSELYNFAQDYETKYNLAINMFQRIMINGIMTPFLLDDICSIEIREETNKSSKYVCISFFDDIIICFHKYGLSLIIDNDEYHSSSAVLGRLFYIYKTKICGDRINPLVIIDNEVVAYCGTAKSVFVPEGVKKIGKNSFENSKVERIHLPNSVSELCEYCFSNCKNLIDIKIGNDDEFIGLEVFELNSKKEPIQLSNRIKKIGKYSFLGCDNLVLKIL